MIRLALLCTTLLLTAACTGKKAPADEPANAANEAAPAAAVAPLGEGSSAAMTDSSGKPVGLVAYAGGDPKGIPLTVSIDGLPAGVHGMHLHATGKCEPPSFDSAGAHWNPGAAKHGRKNPQGPHAGDLGNIIIDAAGKGRAEHLIPKGAGDYSTGLSLVIHASPDDETTDPSGNSGERIACGVVIPG